MFFFFFNDTATTEIYTLSLHDALPISYQILQISHLDFLLPESRFHKEFLFVCRQKNALGAGRSEEHTLNSSHSQISYAVFCLKKKKKTNVTLDSCMTSHLHD